MSWQEEMEELARRKSLAAQLGGAEKVARHKGLGKLTVRERIDALVDAGSFHELGSIAGKASYDADGKLSGFMPANLVMGRARIDGRPLAVAGDDFTVRGGAADAAIRGKLVTVERMAQDLRIPLVLSAPAPRRLTRCARRERICHHAHWLTLQSRSEAGCGAHPGGMSRANRVQGAAIGANGRYEARSAGLILLSVT